MEIYKFGKYFIGKKNAEKREIIEEFDNFTIKLENNTEINAIANINQDGYYFKILAVYRNGKIYRGTRYHTKYMATVRDTIFEYYKENGEVAWL